MRTVLGYSTYRSVAYPDVAVELRPLELGDFQRTAGLFIELGLGKVGASSLALLSEPRLPRLVAELLPKYGRNLVGLSLEDEQGVVRDVKLEDLGTVGPLLAVGIELLTELFQRSQLKSVDAKNSGAPVPG